MILGAFCCGTDSFLSSIVIFYGVILRRILPLLQSYLFPLRDW